MLLLEYRGYGIHPNSDASFPSVLHDLAVVVSHVLECWDGPLVLYGSQLGAVAVLHFVLTLCSPSRVKSDKRTNLFRTILAGVICDKMQTVTEHLQNEAEELAPYVMCPLVLSTPSCDSVVVTSIRLLATHFHNASFHYNTDVISDSSSSSLLSPPPQPLGQSKKRGSGDSLSRGQEDEKKKGKEKKGKEQDKAQEVEEPKEDLFKAIFSSVESLKKPLDQFFYLRSSSSRTPILVRCSAEGKYLTVDGNESDSMESSPSEPFPISASSSTSFSFLSSSSSSSSFKADGGVDSPRDEKSSSSSRLIRRRHNRSHSQGFLLSSSPSQKSLESVSVSDQPPPMGALAEVVDYSVKEEEKPYQDIRKWLQKRGMDAWYADFFVSLKLYSVKSIARIPLDSECLQCYSFLHRIIEEARDSIDLSEMSWSEAKTLLSSSTPLILRPESRTHKRVRIPDSVVEGWRNPVKNIQPANISLSLTHPRDSAPSICVTIAQNNSQQAFLQPLPPSSRMRSNSSVDDRRIFQSLDLPTSSLAPTGTTDRSPRSARRPRRNTVFSLDGSDANETGGKDSGRGSKRNTLRRVKQLFLGKGGDEIPQ